MRALDLAAELAQRFVCVQGMFAAHCQTGDLYRDFVVKGSPGSEAQLVTEAKALFDLYATNWLEANAEGSTPTLYWRYAPPHVFYLDDDEDGTFGPPRAALRMRLVLSNKPVIWTDFAAYDVWRCEQLRDALLGPRHGNA